MGLFNYQLLFFGSHVKSLASTKASLGSVSKPTVETTSESKVLELLHDRGRTRYYLWLSRRY